MGAGAGLGENPAEELSETPAQEAAEDAMEGNVASTEVPVTETPEHVRSLMDAAHAARAAREEHGRAAVQAGPGGGGSVDVPGIDEPSPLGLHETSDAPYTDG